MFENPYLHWTLLVALIVVCGGFSSAEAALFSLAPLRLVQMEEDGTKSAAVIRKLLESPRELIVSLGVGSELSRAGLVVLITWMAASRGYLPSTEGELLWHGYPLLTIAVAFAASVFVLLFAAQAAPKAVGVFYNDGISRAVAPSVLAFKRLAFPVWWSFQLIVNFFFRALGAGDWESIEDQMEESDMKGLVESGSRDGLLDVTERELLVNLLRSGDITAEEIMTPRHEIVGISADDSLLAAGALIQKQNYSRIPVYEGDLENIVGIITAKSLLRPVAAGRKRESVAVREVMRPPLHVPESRRLRDLMLDFKNSRNHMGLVVDEFGSHVGLVTMEDVLEEIFGEVREREEAEFERVGDNHWHVQGRLELREFNVRTGADIPSDVTRTVAGLVLSFLGRRPRPGDEVRIYGFRFMVLECHGIIINRLDVVREETE
ncbi:MAG: hemolysin family protein [bacterium]